MLKAKYVYPAIFERDSEGGFGVSIPDLHAYADGNDFVEAVANAKSAARVALYRLYSRDVAVPEPSLPAEIELNPGEQICALEIDMAQYVVALERRMFEQTTTFQTALEENFAFN